MELQHPLDELFTSHKGVYLVSSSNINSCITNSFMASVPGHPLWLDCIETLSVERRNEKAFICMVYW